MSPTTGPLAPSQALLNEGLGMATTASAVSRHLRTSGFHVRVHQAKTVAVITVTANTPERAGEVMAHLLQSGYAAEPRPNVSRQVLVHGKRPKGRRRLDPAQYIPAIPAIDPQEPTP